MRNIAGQLMPYRDGVKVGLLRSSNCARAIVPIEASPGNLEELMRYQRIRVGAQLEESAGVQIMMETYL